MHSLGNGLFLLPGNPDLLALAPAKTVADAQFTLDHYRRPIDTLLNAVRVAVFVVVHQSPAGAETNIEYETAVGNDLVTQAKADTHTIRTVIGKTGSIVIIPVAMYIAEESIQVKAVCTIFGTKVIFAHHVGSDIGTLDIRDLVGAKAEGKFHAEVFRDAEIGANAQVAKKQTDRIGRDINLGICRLKRAQADKHYQDRQRIVSHKK